MSVTGLDVQSRTAPFQLQLSDADERWVTVPPGGVWKAKVLRTAKAFRDPAVWAPAALFVLIFLLAFLGPIVFRLPSPDTGILSQQNLPVGSPGHLLGTNGLGNDMLSRMLHGGQVSITVGLGATAIGGAIGMTIGMIAGFFGGSVDTVLMRMIDVFLSFPGLILALTIATFLGPNERDSIIAISFFVLSAYARLARSQTLSIRHRDYVTAARANGAKSRRIIFGHVFPNILPPLLAYAMVTIGGAMLIEAALSFLGLGIQPPQPSWGNLIASGEPTMTTYPMLVVEPSIALFLTVLSLNLLADGLRRRLVLDR